jgi:hypothetical protein
MSDVDVARTTRLQQVTVAAIVRAARRGLLTVAEAGMLIDAIRAQATTPSASVQDSHPAGVAGYQPSYAAVDPDRTVL